MPRERQQRDTRSQSARGRTMKPVAIGIGHVALGLVAISLIGLIFKGGITSGICVGTMSVMVLFASYLSYDLGRKDAQSKEAR